MFIEREMAVRRHPLRICFLLFVIAGSVYGYAAQDETFRAEYRIEKTFTLSYGVGDPQGLAQVGLSPYQLSLDQTLAVDLTGEALSLLTLNIHFNDQEPSSMQSWTMNLHAGDLQGVFGDFSLAGQETFAVYNKTLKGVRLDYAMGEAHLTGILSQIEGISESRTFVGQTARDEILFSATLPEQPWVDQPYPRQIDGLYYYELVEPFVEDFSEVRLAFVISSELETFLAAYDLGYLFDLLAASPAKAPPQGSFVVVSDTETFLLLKREPRALLRDRLREAILAYNQEEELTGEERKSYPFNTGTEYEYTFLDQLAALTDLIVDGTSYPLASGERRRFYALQQTNVKESSLRVEVSVDGGTFLPISDPALSDYQVELFSSEGILRLDFPAAFFASRESAVRVTFDYAISGNIFMLGLSLLSGSERVYLNDTLLERDKDYSIDYELGALTLFVDVGDEDVIRIDYERSRGGLGVVTEYGRYFTGVTLEWPFSETVALEWSLLQAVDSLPLNWDWSTAHTMPNRHTVTGLVGSVQLAGFNADFTVGYSDDRFPLDDNLRVNLPNEVTDILVLPDYTFVSDLRGVSVYHDGMWTGYDSSDGLSGSRVYDMVSDGERIFFATGSGLTVLSLTGGAPLDHVGNWRRYYKDDGLPNTIVYALALVDGTLWVGTEEGMASVRVEEIEDSSQWHVYVDAPFSDAGRILALAGDDDAVYIGTDRGLFHYDTVTQTLNEIADMHGFLIHDLLSTGQTLYVASENGLRTFHNGVGSGWLVFGEKVYSLALVDGELLYGSERGLFQAQTGKAVVTDWEVTALTASSEGTVWGGSRADSEYRLRIWRIQGGQTQAFDNVQTEIDGHDPSRFADIPAQDHTDRGFLGRVNFYRDMGAVVLQGGFESVSPTFTSIGRLDRQDSTGWNLSATADLLEDMELEASHRYSLVDWRSDRPSSVMENQISFSWNPGPSLDLSFGHLMVNDDQLHDGFDRSDLSYGLSVQDKLFEERLTLAVSWQDEFDRDELLDTWSRKNQLGIKGKLQLSSDLSASLSWGRPMTVTEEKRTASEKWGLNAGWTHRFETVQASATYGLAATRVVPDGLFQSNQTAKIGLNFERLALAAWQITPSLDLSLANQEGVTSVTGRGTLSGKIEMLSARLTCSRELSGWGEPRSREKDQLSLNLDYMGVPGLRPTLTYATGTTTVVYHGEVRRSTDHTLTGRVRWTSEGGPQDDLSLTVAGKAKGEEESLTATLRNTFFYSLSENISTSLDLNGRYSADKDDPDFGLTVKSSTTVALSKTWRSSLELSYLTGLKSSGGLYHSLLIELFFAGVFE